MTTLSHTRHLLINSFIDEAFDLNRLNDYQLSIVLSMDGIKAAVLDKSSNKYIGFEQFSFQNTFDSTTLALQFNAAVSESRLLAQKYKQVSCSIENNLATLVPDALFDQENIKQYLQFNIPLEGDEFVLSETVLSLNAKTVFAVPRTLKAAIDNTYPKVVYHHFSSSLIEGLMQQSKNIAKKRLFIHVQASHFEVIVIEGKKLIFYNSFQHHTSEDLLYYLMFVCEQLQLNPETVELFLLGEIEKSSAIHNLIQKYIRVVKFHSRNDNAELSYQLQTFPKHFYFTLFNNFLVR